MTRPPALVLFDLDGCLVDSTAAIAGAINHALTILGMEPRPVGELRRFVGPPLVDSFEILLAEADAPVGWAAPAVDAYREHYARTSLAETRVVADIPEVLEALGSTCALRVVTSKPRAFAMPIVEHLGLATHFDEVHGPGTDLRPEPKSQTLARALAAAGVPASTAVMVGDRRHDVEAGRSRGTGTVGVTWGAGDLDELVEAGADHVVDHPVELLAVLG